MSGTNTNCKAPTHELIVRTESSCTSLLSSTPGGGGASSSTPHSPLPHWSLVWSACRHQSSRNPTTSPTSKNDAAGGKEATERRFNNLTILARRCCGTYVSATPVYPRRACFGKNGPSSPRSYDCVKKTVRLSDRNSLSICAPSKHFLIIFGSQDTQEVRLVCSTAESRMIACSEHLGALLKDNFLEIHISLRNAKISLKVFRGRLKQP